MKPSAARVAALFAGLMIVLAACQSGGADLLTKVQDAGVIKVSTDPNYEPQSFLDDNGELIGFDIDVAKEIAERLGVDIEFVTPTFDLVQAGEWNGQWDLSVGSITITEPRLEVLSFSPPYYFTPAQFAATEASGITSIEGFAGTSVCVAAATTYLDWINGDLVLGDGSELAPVPEGIEPVVLETDALCAEAIEAGRDDFEGWISSSTTVAAAIDGGVAIVEVGDPIFYEPLAAATDKSGPNNEAFMTELTDIVNAMHEDGTLTELSLQWYGIDITTKAE
jgi:polar amino acid transport system substrate-binding protein